MTIHVSVVVPTYRRPEFLERCLTALVDQDFDPAAYEVIIVDDADYEKTKAQVECWRERVQLTGPCIRYLPVNDYARHGPAAARNRGWSAARGHIIAFTDDDCIPERTWLRAGVAAFHDDVACATGRIIVPLAQMPTDYERDAAQLERSEFATANSFYRRDALLAVGGFDERFTSAWREDSDLFFTLLERDMSCVSVPQAVVVHPIRPAHWGVSLQQQRKSQFNALLYKKHPTLYQQKIGSTPPWRYYAIVGSFLIGLLGASIRSRHTLLLGFGAWLCLTAQFCGQRLRGTSHAASHIAEMIVTSFLIPPLSIFWRLRGAMKYRVLFL